jgi:membrane protein implicated in regulation of membrane protease activity
MNWPQLFLACFLIGFLLSVLSFALGAVNVHVHMHLPFLHHAHVPHGHVESFNFATLMAFLAWFGGTGYLLTSRFGWWAIPSIAAAVAAGLIGASIVFWVMAHVLWSPHENMQSADYQMVGVLGRLSNPIREGGTGEIVYAHGGTRHSCGARSADGQAIEKGQEVLITAYDRGIAYVKRWEE